MKLQLELNRQTWDRIESVFHRALDVSGAERSDLLDQLCGSDLTIRREVEEMLAAHEGKDALIAEHRLVTGNVPNAELDGALAAGTRVGPYRIVSLIGAGGMGDVYRAERDDGAYRQTVALKVLRPGYRTTEMVRRFRVEREALARLVHPSIATILDGGSLEDGRPYIVLQFVTGRRSRRTARNMRSTSAIASRYFSRSRMRYNLRTRVWSYIVTSSPSTFWCNATAGRACSTLESRN